VFRYLNRGRIFYTTIVSLAAPIVLQNMITTALGLCDTFMVGLLGEEAMSAVTLANVPIFIIQLLVFGIQSGSAVLISQFWGKNDLASINRVMGVGCYVAGGISTLFALVLFFFPNGVMGLVTNNAALIPTAADYARIVGFSYIFNSLTGVYVGAHRSMENPRLGLYIFTASMLANTFLNWVLIFGNLGAPRLGAQGAAWATLISRVLEFAIMLTCALRSRRFRLQFGLLLRPGGEMARRFVRYATPVMMNETLWGLGTSVYTTIMGHMDGSTEIVAAYTVASAIERLFTVFMFGVAGTAAILVGKEIGSGRRDTVYEVGAALNTLAFLVGVAIGGAMLILTRVVFEPYVYPLFQLSESARSIATMMLTVISCVLPARSFECTNIVGVLRGGGDVRMATIIDLTPLWLVSIPLAALCGLVLQVGILWVYLSMSLENIIKTVIGFLRFHSRAWIHDVTVAVSSDEGKGSSYG